MKIISWILLIFGGLLLTSLFTASMGDRDDYFYMFSIALTFVVLGALGLEYVRRHYTGGAPTIIGAIFVLMAAQFLVLALEEYFRGLDTQLVQGGAIAVIVFLLPGIILFRYGQKIHNKKN